MNPRLIVIGMGGFSSSLILPWIYKGWLPNIEYLISRGKSGEINSNFPLCWTSEWASLLTGMEPSYTGYFDSISKRSGSYFPEITNLSSLHHNGIWNRSSEFKKIQTALINIPNLHPFPKMPTINHGPLNVLFNFPSEVEKIKKVFPSRKKNLTFNNRSDKTQLNSVELIQQEIEEVILQGNLYAGLLKSTKSQLIVGHFYGPSRILSRFWEYVEALIPQKSNTKLTLIHENIILFFKVLDDVIGRVLETIHSNDMLLLFSGHGYGPLQKIININEFLNDLGLFSYKDLKEKDKILNNYISPLLRKFGVRRNVAKKIIDPWGGIYLTNLLDRVALPFSSEIGFVDWLNTKAFSISRKGIHLNVYGHEALGTVKSSSEFRNIGELIIRELLSLSDPFSGRRIFYDVKWRDEIYEGPQLKNLPHLIFNSWDQTFQIANLYQNKSNPTIFSNPVERTGTEIKDGFFVTYGFDPSIYFNSETLSLLDLSTLIFKNINK